MKDLLPRIKKRIIAFVICLMFCMQTSCVVSEKQTSFGYNFSLLMEKEEDVVISSLQKTKIHLSNPEDLSTVTVYSFEEEIEGLAFRSVLEFYSKSGIQTRQLEIIRRNWFEKDLTKEDLRNLKRVIRKLFLIYGDPTEIEIQNQKYKWDDLSTEKISGILDLAFIDQMADASFIWETDQSIKAVTAICLLSRNDEKSLYLAFYGSSAWQQRKEHDILSE